jgi:hypothetical protein
LSLSFAGTFRLASERLRIKEYRERADLTDKDRKTFNELPDERAQLSYLDQIDEVKEDQAAEARQKRVLPRP